VHRTRDQKGVSYYSSCVLVGLDVLMAGMTGLIIGLMFAALK